MSLRTLRALAALALALAASGLLAAAHLAGAQRHQAGPIYGYICVGGYSLSGRPLPEICVLSPAGTGSA